MKNIKLYLFFITFILFSCNKYIGVYTSGVASIELKKNPLIIILKAMIYTNIYLKVNMK